MFNFFYKMRYFHLLLDKKVSLSDFTSLVDLTISPHGRLRNSRSKGDLSLVSREWEPCTKFNDI